MLNLAEQFIAAMPARIKNEGDLDMTNQMPGSNGTSISNFGSTCSPLICDTSQSDDLGIESMGDDLDYEFDFNLQVILKMKYFANAIFTIFKHKLVYHSRLDLNKISISFIGRRG